MFEAKDSEGFYWKFSSEPTITEDGWNCSSHFSSMPNHEDNYQEWQNSLKEL